MKSIKLFLNLFLLIPACIYGQVGINTEDPKASLHVVPQTLDGTTPEGIIFPNLTRAQLISKDALYGSDNIGAAVYITSIDGLASEKTKYVTSTDYYYFDGSYWRSMTSSTVGASQAKIEVKSVTKKKQGSLNRNKTISWNSVRQTVEVDVKSVGAYHIFTEKQEGVQFEACGIFEKTGIYEVDLIASGTPSKGGSIDYPIVQPVTSNKLNWVTLVSDETGNTSNFIYNLSTSNYVVNEKEKITITLNCIFGTEPANKLVKWFVDNQEIEDNDFKLSGVTSKTDTQITISRPNNSRAEVFAMIIDNDSPGIYFITNKTILQWNTPWLWNISGKQFENKIIYWKILGKNDFLKDSTPPSSCRCKKQYGPFAELSTFRELVATRPTNLTLQFLLSKIYAKTIDLNLDLKSLYYNIYTKNTMSDVIMRPTQIGSSIILLDINTRGMRFTVNATKMNADFWLSIIDQEAGLDASTPSQNLGIGTAGEFKSWINNMSNSSRSMIGRIFGSGQNSVWKGTYDTTWKDGILKGESQEITIFGCSVPITLNNENSPNI